ncbi:MAG: tRNA (adenosine(37)-N6)-dimethylallyltransferase MiaA [Clostridia bacterium]|nr:tRNA (adenosine(37)-N6)-dimethylallyltransferase MiaA [Clostridia bacterium]
MKKPVVVFVVGPTASGKTELAAKLAKHFDSAVISADSMQIYKCMHIASAAPDEEEMYGVPHKLFEFLPYGEAYTVADYAQAARSEVDKLLSAGKTPVVAGGTGLYINALADNISFLPAKTDCVLRERLEAEFDRSGGETMLKKLAEIDKATADKLSVSDRRRIIRALEIYYTSGFTKSEQDARSKDSPPYFYPIIIGLNYLNRKTLYDKINVRVDKMIEKGLITEARQAFEKNIKTGAAQAIGHKEFFGHFRGEQSQAEAIDALKRATRRYAKRQLTWFNRDMRINWIYRDEAEDAFAQALKIIETEEKRNV